MTKGKKNTLSIKNQPEAVHQWLKRYCDLTDMPDVTRYVWKFSTDWQAWYIGLQPQWCIDAGPDAEDSVDITTLACDPPDNAALC